MKQKIIFLLVATSLSIISYAQDYNSIMKGDFKEAISLQQNGQLQQSHIKMRTLADKGFPLAQFELARNYDSGMGCAVDFVEAYKWMSKAAYNTTWDKVPESVRDFQGAAFFYLGIYNMSGMGTAKNLAEAVKLWQKGSAYSSPYQANCFLQLAFGYERGWDGLIRSPYKAVEMFQKASDLGDADAAFYLAVYYANGDGGLKQSDLNAFNYTKLSAERGFSNAVLAMGTIYEGGEFGQIRDMDKAVEWYIKAAKMNVTDAIVRLSELGVNWK